MLYGLASSTSVAPAGSMSRHGPSFGRFFFLPSISLYPAFVLVSLGFITLTYFRSRLPLHKLSTLASVNDRAALTNPFRHPDVALNPASSEDLPPRAPGPRLTTAAVVPPTAAVAPPAAAAAAVPPAAAAAPPAAAGALPTTAVARPGLRQAEAGMRSPHAPPAWCADLLAKPRSMLRGSTCRRSTLQDLCSDRRPAYFSQLNHDYFLYENHFKHLGRPGVYLDLAANHAKEISNTYVFDTCLGWRGFCVEANERYFKELREWRTCELLTKCVSDKVETVKFVKYLGLSGIGETNKNMKQLQKPRMKRQVREENMTCTVLGEEVRKREYLQNIDYMSLDLEGHERKILGSIDWDHTKIKVVSLEVGEDKSAAEFLIGKGYTILTLPRCKFNRTQDAHCIADADEILLAPGVVLGKPE